MIEWLLVDYGEVISTRLPDDTVNELGALAGQNPEQFLRRDPDDLGPMVDQLTRIDVHGWLRVNSLTLRNLLIHTRRTRSRLALLSNAPEPLAAAIERCYWSRHFTRRFYSCRLGHAKPDPAAFTAALAHLQADAHDVLFIDDRPDNTRAAAELGLPTITFTSASALGRELRLTHSPQ